MIQRQPDEERPVPVPQLLQPRLIVEEAFNQRQNLNDQFTTFRSHLDPVLEESKVNCVPKVPLKTANVFDLNQRNLLAFAERKDSFDSQEEVKDYKIEESFTKDNEKEVSSFQNSLRRESCDPPDQNSLMFMNSGNNEFVDRYAAIRTRQRFIINDSEGGEPSIEPSSFISAEKSHHRDEMQT